MLYDNSATAAELRGARIDLAVLPIGAIEQHSHHLPLGTDWMIAQALARRAAEWLAAEHQVWLLPALPYSLSQCHGPLPGTVWLSPETLADVLRDAVESLLAQGITHIAIINGHGGNFILSDEIQELSLRHPEAILVEATAWGARCRNGRGGPSGRVVGGDIHAGASETSAILALSPQDVGPESSDYVPPVGREFLDYATMDQISPHGVWGLPSEGSAEGGSLSLGPSAELLGENIARAIEEIHALRGGAP